MVAVVAVGALQVGLGVWRGVFCIVRTVRPQVGGPIRRDGPFPLLDKPSLKVLSNYVGIPGDWIFYGLR